MLSTDIGTLQIPSAIIKILMQNRSCLSGNVRFSYKEEFILRNGVVAEVLYRVILLGV